MSPLISLISLISLIPKSHHELCTPARMTICLSHAQCPMPHALFLSINNHQYLVHTLQEL
ncbi:hypothetical protein FDUTEX481_02351 [Tolypothrix sp. PCC 7601]|nr:hypothetical protein FDUTEX481_02351 [Tolypothrix sp. PCC 7601]